MEDAHRRKYIRQPLADNALVALRRHVTTTIRFVLLAVGGVFLVLLTRAYASDLSDVRFHVDALGLVGASLLWMSSYVFLVRLWASSMTWWGTVVGLRSALRVFAAANLARYIPGGVWQFASLAAMSASRGLSMVAVTSAAVFQQVVLAGVGLVLALAFAPTTRLGGPWTVPLPVLLTLSLAGVAALVALLPSVVRTIDAWLARRRKIVITLPRISVRNVAAYVLLTALGWIGYAAAFVLFAHAVLDSIPVPPLELGASFVLSYVAGILAVFAPGGLVVREAALVALLAPAFGGENALALALASRLWLTVLDGGLSALMLINVSRPPDGPLP